MNIDPRPRPLSGGVLMANIINIPGGGGSGKLTWNLQTGLTAPPVQADGLWVELDEPVKNLKVVFDSIRPAAPADKTLFVRYYGGKGYPKVLPLAGQDGLRYEVVAAQYYTQAEGWRNVNAYRELDRAWARFSQGEYYFYAWSDGAVRKYNKNGQEQWLASIATTAFYALEFDYVHRAIWAVVDSSTTASSSGNVQVIRIASEDGTVLGRGPTCSRSAKPGFLSVLVSPAFAEGPVVAIGDGRSGSVSLYRASLETLELTLIKDSYHTGSELVSSPGGSIFRHYANGVNTMAIDTNPLTGNDNYTSLSRAYNYNNGSGELHDIRPDGVCITSYYKYGYYHYGWNLLTGATSPAVGVNFGSGDNGGGYYCGRYTPSGDYLVGTAAGIGFCTVSENGTITAPFKKLLPGERFLNIAIGREGFLAGGGNSIYFIDYEDNIVATIPLGDGKFQQFTAEPGPLFAYQELYKNE